MKRMIFELDTLEEKGHNFAFHQIMSYYKKIKKEIFMRDILE